MLRGMIIDIISDTICPWCFIGKRRLERALTLSPQPELQVTWHPFQLNPDMPAQGMKRREYMRLKFGDEQGSSTYDAIREAGAGEGIEFNFAGIERTPNTIESHRLVRYADQFGMQNQIVEALFNAYFLDGRDIGDGLTLLDIGSGAELERGPLADYLESGEGKAEVEDEDRLARRMGVQGVPCFIFERKYVITGAQSSDVLAQAFELINKREAEGNSEGEPEQA